MAEVNQSQLSKELGVSRMAITKAVKSGRLAKLPNGKLDLEKAIEDWHRNGNIAKRGFRTQQENSPSSIDDFAKFNQARAEREGALAALAKLELKDKENSLVDAEVMKKAIADLTRMTKNHFLSLPKKLAHVLVGLADERAIAKKIHEELVTALQSLTATSPKET